MDKGFSRSAIDRLVQDEDLLPEPHARGIYRIAERELSLHHDLLVVALYAPTAVFCLLTALSWHRLRCPCADVWLSVPAPSRFPDLRQLPLAPVRPRVVRDDWERNTVNLDEVPMLFTSPAQTVADCFQHRTRVGLDVAVAALHEAVRSGAASAEDLWRCAGASSVKGVMLPYMESIG